MTSSYEFPFVIKLMSGEPSTTSACAMGELADRVKAEEPDLEFIRCPEGLGVESLPAAERICKNAKINREGRMELYIDADPIGANLARCATWV